MQIIHKDQLENYEESFVIEIFSRKKKRKYSYIIYNMNDSKECVGA